MDIIFLKDLRLETVIGIFDWERKIRQTVSLDLEMAAKAGGREVEIPADDPPEPLVGGKVDLGAIATEFLILGLDPYPRKPGTVFACPSAGDDISHPFSALAALKKDQSSHDD